LSSHGISRPFDEKADGIVRSEAISVVFLQKLKDAKRVYAHLLYTRCNNDGYKSEGSYYPSRFMQQKLFEECYSELGLSPHQIGFVEMHATSTVIGDAEEVASVEGAFCKGRKEPLLVGSVKSNMGHSEATAAMSSLTKLILTLENQRIPPNINLEELRKDIPALVEGRIEVVTEETTYINPYVALNSFGLGGANVHAVLKGNEKAKFNGGAPSDSLERLVCWSGRTENALHAVFDDITKRPLDAEHIALLQNSQAIPSLSNVYRGYGIFKQNSETANATCIERKINQCDSVKKPVVWVYSGIGSQWAGMGADLMRIPTFANSIDACHKVLLSKGLNLRQIITDTDEKVFKNVLHSYVGIVAIEIALTDLMKSLGMEPDFIIGHSVGEVACSYCDGCTTLEETILIAHARGQASNNTKQITGGMAAVGMSHFEVEKILPDDIDVACHNSADSTSISGPADSVTAFVNRLSDDKVFARVINSSGIALHSRYIKTMGKNFNRMLVKIIKSPRKRSEKWLSSTYPSDEWLLEESQFSSAGYHTKNLISPVLFQEVTDKLPECFTIEVAPHGLLLPILRRSMKESKHFSLTKRKEENGILFFLNAMGG
jgi:fatty acid synthase, animal type